MLSGISWQQFGLFLFLSVLVYYSWLAIRFGRADWKAVLSIRQFPVQAAKEHPSQQPEDPLLPAMHALLQGLEGIYQAAADGLYHKDELLLTIRQELQKHPLLKNSPFQQVVSEQIYRTLDQRSELVITLSDIHRCW